MGFGAFLQNPDPHVIKDLHHLWTAAYITKCFVHNENQLNQISNTKAMSGAGEL